MSPRSERLGPNAIILLGIFALTLLRLGFAAAIPLTEDEAYYRLWSQHLQLGYYDHPPMVAWWMRLGQEIAGADALGARLLAVIAAGGTSLLMLDLARLAGYAPATCRRAVLWYNAAPLVGFGSILMIPDAPASFFWTLTLWALLRAQASALARRGWWLVAGFAAGAAALSKYSALFLAPGILWQLLGSQQGRRWLKTPWPWTAAAIAGGLFLINVYWNAGHHWLTLAKQFGRIAPRGFQPWRLATFLGALILLINPLITPFLFRGVRDELRRVQHAHDQPSSAKGGAGLILISGAPFFGYLCLHALHASVQAHWPAPLYPALAILAAGGAAGTLSPRSKRLAVVAPWLGLSLSTLALAHLALPQTDHLGPRDPAKVLRGWPRFAARLETLRVKAGADWIGAVSFGTTSQLLANTTSRAPVMQVTERSRYGFASPPPARMLVGTGIVADLTRRIETARLETCFSDVRVLASLVRDDVSGSSSSGQGSRYTVLRVSGPKRDLASTGCQSFHNGHADD